MVKKLPSGRRYQHQNIILIPTPPNWLGEHVLGSWILSCTYRCSHTFGSSVRPNALAKDGLTFSARISMHKIRPTAKTGKTRSHLFRKEMHPSEFRKSGPPPSFTTCKTGPLDVALSSRALKRFPLCWVGCCIGNCCRISPCLTHNHTQSPARIRVAGEGGYHYYCATEETTGRELKTVAGFRPLSRIRSKQW